MSEDTYREFRLMPLNRLSLGQLRALSGKGPVMPPPQLATKADFQRWIERERESLRDQQRPTSPGRFKHPLGDEAISAAEANAWLAEQPEYSGW